MSQIFSNEKPKNEKKKLNWPISEKKKKLIYKVRSFKTLPLHSIPSLSTLLFLLLLHQHLNRLQV